MLFLIGLGLDTKDLSALALEEIKEADSLFLETYTSFIPDEYMKFIEKQAGRKPEPLKRKDLEDDLKRTVALAKEKKVVILVPGDPLIATTHSIVLTEAKEQGIRCRVIHAPSVFSVAIGESGLDVYRFGPTVTVPFWHKNYKPISFIDAIKRNLENGQHTLLLLDIDQKDFAPMSIDEATDLLNAADKEAKSNPINHDLKLVILANLGRGDQAVKYLRIEEIDAEVRKELEGKVLSLIIPAKLTFAEQESLQRAAGK